MSTTAQTQYAHLGETRGMEDHDHGLLQELSRRLDGLWRYDHFIANAAPQSELRAFWRGAKAQEQENIQQLKKLLQHHIQSKCF